MKNRASGLLKQVLVALSSMAKSKSLALKSKANAIKVRLMIFCLVRNHKFLMSSISDKFHSVVGHHSRHKEECSLEDGCDQNSGETQVVDGYQSYYYRYGGEDDDDDGKYSDLTHTEDLDLGASVIDLMKNSKEEAGQEFRMEDDIDHMADLFIKKFRRQIILQKQESMKRYQEMLPRGA